MGEGGALRERVGEKGGCERREKRGIGGSTKERERRDRKQS